MSNTLDDRLIFPPFPKAPPGAMIIPFKDFKERGIQMFPEADSDDIERDGLGLPTVSLNKRHDTDQCKTDTNRKKNVELVSLQKAHADPHARKEWWDVWMETEDSKLKMTGPYNP